ncbi:hypothetical protein Franean1_5785 [Parafrankia sp. EAN1pec]|nr:hypothetical protein Franean1_5785 [Frankia sp. EAN1pec]
MRKTVNSGRIDTVRCDHGVSARQAPNDGRRRASERARPERSQEPAVADTPCRTVGCRQPDPHNGQASTAGGPARRAAVRRDCCHGPAVTRTAREARRQDLLHRARAEDVPH